MGLKVIQSGSRHGDEDKDQRVNSEHGRHRVSTSTVILIILLVLLLVAVTALVVLTGGASPDPVLSGSPSPTVSESADAGSFEQQVMEWKQMNSDTVVEEIVPGLNRCSSRVEGVNTVSWTSPSGLVWGTGFPQTIEGSVASSATALSYMMSVDWGLPDSTMRDYWFLDPADQTTDEERAEWRAKWNLDDKGRILDASGSVREDSELRMAGYPRYGMYRIDAIERDSSDAPDAVTLDWIVPWVSWMYGTGTDGTAAISWLSVTMVWEDGDWHVRSLLHSQNLPADGSPYVNIGWDLLAVYGGPGWCVSADATQDAIPGYWLTQS